MKDSHKKESPLLSLPSFGGGSNSSSAGIGLPPDSDPWYARYGTSNYDYASAMVLDGSRNIYVTGGDDGNSFVAKFDNDGALQWTRKIFVYGYGQTSIAISGGDIYVVGTWYNSSVGYDTGWIAKYNTSGSIQWQKSFTNSSNHIYFREVTTDPSGNIYVAGYHTSSSSPTEVGIVVKFDSTGSVSWARKVTNTSSYNLRLDGITYVPASGSYSAGICVSGDVPNYEFSGSTYNQSIVAIRYDLSGSLEWQKVIGDSYSYMYVNSNSYSFMQTSDRNCTKSIVSDSSGNIYLTGGGYGTHYNDTHSYISKMTDAGAITWARRYSYAFRGSFVSGVALDSSNDVFLSLWFNAYNSPGYAAIVKLSGSTGTGTGSGDNSNSNPDTAEAMFHSTWYNSSYPTFTGTNASCWFRGIQTDNRGNIYLFGSANNFLGASTGRELALFKFQPTTAVINKTYGSNPYGFSLYAHTSPNMYNYDATAYSGSLSQQFASRTSSFTDASFTNSVSTATATEQASSGTATTVTW